MAPKARRARAAPVPSSRPEDRGRFHVAGFLARRLLAFSYCAAFLSLGVQVEGLFGCSGVHPAEEVSVTAMTFTAWLGAALAGVTFLALGPTDESSTAVFATLWFCYAACMMLVPDGPPNFYPFREDKLLLEAGLALIVFVQEQRPSRTESLGRLLAAWCLFRYRFTVMFKKMSGSCDVWRSFTALQAAYQLEAFPLPSTWPLQLAPVPVLRAVMAFQTAAALIASPWLLSPSQSTQAVVGFVQLLHVTLDAMLANQGTLWPCSLVLIVLLFDDALLKEALSHNLLESWGCSLKAVHKDAEEELPTADQIWPALLFFALSCVGLTAWSFQAALPGQALLLMVAAALVVAIIGLSLRAMRLRVGVIGFSVGAAIFLASSLQLHRELAAPVESLGGVSLGPGKSLEWLAKRIEDAHVAHAFSLGPDSSLVCPDDLGRQDLVLQGYIAGPTGQSRLTSLSSRQLPAAEPAKKPPLVQPYSPRMDFALWQLAQRKKKRSKTPAWLVRLTASVAARQGAAAELAAGPFEKGIRSLIYGNFSDSYATLTPPVPMIRFIRFRHLLMQDVHSEKWFNRTEATNWADFEWDELEPISKQMQACAVRPWASLPIEEALATLLLASFLWRVFVAPANR